MTMPHHRLVIAASAVLAVLLPWGHLARAGGNGEYDPFRIPREKFRAEVKTVAIAPVDVAAGSPEWKAARADIEAMVLGALGRAGFATVGSSEYGRLWNDFATSLGGVFDPVTGRPDVEKWKACREHVARELGRTKGIDAIVFPGLTYDGLSYHTRGAFFGGPGKAYALNEPLKMRGKTIEGIPSLNSPQVVMASWFGMTVRDLAATDLYSLAYPIEYTRVYAMRSWEDRPGGELQSRTRLQEVIEKVAQRMVSNTTDEP